MGRYLNSSMDRLFSWLALHDACIARVSCWSLAAFAGARHEDKELSGDNKAGIVVPGGDGSLEQVVRLGQVGERPHAHAIPGGAVDIGG